MKAKTTPLTNPSVSAKSAARNLIVVGYSATTVGLLADLPTIGTSGTPAAVSIGTAGLIAIGILLATGGILRLRRAVDSNRRSTRRGLAMLSFGLIGLLLGVLAVEISSSLPVLFLTAAMVVGAAVVAIVGGILLRDHYSDIDARSSTKAGYMVLGTSLIFVGMGVVLGSSIGYYFVLSDVWSTVVNDAGVAVSAGGCVFAAYSAS